MALIADCDITTPIVDGASWVDPTTLNIPMTKNAMGATVPTFHNHAMISSESDGSDLCIQTITGVNEASNLLMAKAQRFSSIVKGHTFGTDWSEWTIVE